MCGEFTKIKDGAPQKEGEYLLQFDDGELQAWDLDNADVAYLNGMEMYVPYSYSLDKIHAWISMDELPTPPAIPYKERQTLNS